MWLLCLLKGPDICGPGTKKVHVIFNYKGKNLLIKRDIRCKDDEFSHLYTLIVKPDNTYEVLIDNESAQKGNLEDDWDFLPSKMINDPEAKKPTDWDDNPKIDDPEDEKPEVCEIFKFCVVVFPVVCQMLCEKFCLVVFPVVGEMLCNFCVVVFMVQ